MPIYAYKCESCGHRQDVLQKLSDPVLSTCPACGAESFNKQITAAGFQLKGSGWYQTDFRNSGAQPPAKAGADDKGAAAEAAPSKDAKSEPAAAGGAPSGTPAPAPAPAPAKGAGPAAPSA